MLKDSAAFSGFSVDNVATAKEFYGDTLGLTVETIKEGLTLKFINGGSVFIYEKPDHQPATYTTLNLPVDDIDAAVAALKAKGVEFEHYEGMTGEDGIARGLAEQNGPDIAWFKDPAGNILSVLHG